MEDATVRTLKEQFLRRRQDVLDTAKGDPDHHALIRLRYRETCSGLGGPGFQRILEQGLEARLCRRNVYALLKLDPVREAYRNARWFSQIRAESLAIDLRFRRLVADEKRKKDLNEINERGSRILRVFVPLETQPDIIGDLEEEFALVLKRHGEKYAKRWFWWQVIWTSGRYFIASIVAALTGKTGSK